ncbi:MAG TPA: bifunctional hydroxymethylpyrimidine kinase/phosphomethylpyrimidine kinase [Solirubrobacterales bacterium]|nr:bifunctional hydroxymethylpyrimidine kinase/phosphomethylpyrimidine kinase [Solirubrobacterales bacterium]
MSEPRRVPAVMSIAGSDSGGGAGIQADLKAFARCGVHGTTAITALTAQNTVGVDSIQPVPPDMVVAQIRAVAEDIGIDAVKTGMLGDTVTIAVVVESLDLAGDAPVVVDPVLVAESGAVLLEQDARSALIERLLPRATVATPNLLEARELTGLGEAGTQEELARAVQGLGPRAAIVTGGHAEDGADLLVQPGGEAIRIEGPRHPAGASHGSGCTHSAVLAAMLARGEDLEGAAREAKRITAEAVGAGLRGIGAGAGPVNVFGHN